jgi:hypothetical protein
VKEAGVKEVAQVRAALSCSIGNSGLSGKEGGGFSTEEMRKVMEQKQN